MILAIDIGGTKFSIAAFDGEQCCAASRMPPIRRAAASG